MVGLKIFLAKWQLRARDITSENNDILLKNLRKTVFLKLPAMLPRRKQKADAGKALLLDALSDTRDIALADVQKDWKALRLASVEMKRDREIVLAAVQQNWRALQYASDAMKGDREIVLEAVKKNAKALKHASGAMKGDREIVLEAVKKDRTVFQYASDELKNDPEVQGAVPPSPSSSSSSGGPY